MKTYKCNKCEFTTVSKQTYEKHLSKQYACDSAPYNCKKCSRPFYSRSSMYKHQKACQGKSESIVEKEKQIQSLKNALAASSGLKAEIKAKQQVINNNVQNNNNISIDTINNITQQIVILPCAQENIKHLKELPFEELKEKIKFNKDPETHVEAFKLIRLDPEHPENHNILLTERDSDKVHFYGDDNTWREGDYVYQIRNAIYDINKNIQNLIPYEQREKSDYYWEHLVRGIGGHCNERNDIALKPIFDGIRDPLHQSTLKLMNSCNQNAHVESIEENYEQMNDLSTAPIEQQIELARQTTRQIESKTRQMEIQLELAKLKNIQTT